MPLKKLFLYSSLSCIFCLAILMFTAHHSSLSKTEVLRRNSNKMVLAKPTSMFMIEWGSHSMDNRYSLHADILLQQKLTYFDYVWHLPNGYSVASGETQGRIEVPDGLSSMPLEIELNIPEGMDEAVTLEVYYWQDTYKIGQTSMYFPRSAKERQVANENKREALRQQQEENQTSLKIMQ